jgi:hypothetical protein
MKKLRIALLVMFFVLVACSPPPIEQGSLAVQVPEEINLAIGVGIAALMTAGAVFVFRKTGLDLSGHATAIASTISLFVVTELQNVINVIPETYDPWVVLIFRVVVLLLGSVGALYLINKPKGQPHTAISREQLTLL